MIEEPGVVVAVEEGAVLVRAEGSSGCSSCASGGGCGVASIARLLGRRDYILRVENDLDAQLGDRVVLGIDEHDLVRGALWMYLLPLAGLFAGAALGLWAAPHADAVSVVGGGVGLLLGLALARHGLAHRSAPASVGVKLLRVNATTVTARGLLAS